MNWVYIYRFFRVSFRDVVSRRFVSKLIEENNLQVVGVRFVFDFT